MQNWSRSEEFERFHFLPIPHSTRKLTIQWLMMSDGFCTLVSIPSVWLSPYCFAPHYRLRLRLRLRRERKPTLKFTTRQDVKLNHKPCDIPGARISNVFGALLTSVGISSTLSLPLIFISWVKVWSMTLNVMAEFPVVGLVKDTMKPFLTGNPWGGLLSLGMITTFLPDLFIIFIEI